MKYQKIDGASNQLSIFKTKNWVETNEEHVMLVAKSNLKLQC